MSLWAFGFTPHVISAGGRAVHRLHVVFPHVCRFRPSGIEARFPFLFASTTTRCHWNSGEKKIRRMKFSQLKPPKHKIPCDETYETMQKPCDSLRSCCAWNVTLPMTGPSMSSLQHPTAQGWWETMLSPDKNGCLEEILLCLHQVFRVLHSKCDEFSRGIHQ